jgi:hypothetical protein
MCYTYFLHPLVNQPQWFGHLLHMIVKSLVNQVRYLAIIKHRIDNGKISFKELRHACGGHLLPWRLQPNVISNYVVGSYETDRGEITGGGGG